MFLFNVGLLTLMNINSLIFLAKLKPKVTLSYPTHKVFVKVSRRFVVGMASRPTSEVVIPSETY